MTNFNECGSKNGLHGGEQRIYRYANGYGASVVCNEYSYGGNDGLWELAVIRWRENNFDIVYDTPITDDVIGYLSEDDVAKLLCEIAALPAPAAAPAAAQ